MEQNGYREQIMGGNIYLGIELGSTRIKAVLTGANHTPIASGSYGWENQYENGIWTYHLEEIWKGLQSCYRDLKEDVQKQYGVSLKQIRAMGISAMMHGYMVFDEKEEASGTISYLEKYDHRRGSRLFDGNVSIQYSAEMEYCTFISGHIKSGRARSEYPVYNHIERISALEADRRKSAGNRRCRRHVPDRFCHEEL